MSEQYEYKFAQADIKGMGIILKPKEFRPKEIEMLNRLGREGWDCYHVNTSDLPALYYMKRKI